MKLIISLIFLSLCIIANCVDDEGTVFIIPKAPVCTQPINGGSECKAHFRAFGYNEKTKTCDEFVYVGCNGNDNRFETVEACEKLCIHGITDDGPK